METKQFSFTGKGGEYFKIWIVNLFLSILTLGIYSAWATVRTRRYFYGNTWLDEANFEYHATPGQILFGRVIAITLLVVYSILSETSPLMSLVLPSLLLAGLPWIVRRSLQFNARMSSYRNVRFSFAGGLGDAYKYLLLIPLMPIGIGVAIVAALYMGQWDNDTLYAVVIGVAFLGFYLITPYIQALFARYHINHSHYGQGRFAAELSAGVYYLIYLKVFLWGLVGGILITIFIAILVSGYLVGVWVSGGMDPTSLNPEADPEVLLMLMTLVPVLVFVYAALIVLAVLLRALLASRLRNYVFGKTGLDDVVALQSDTSAGGLFRVLLVNLLLVVVSLGLALPWAKVRLARYTADHTQAIVQGDLGQYVTKQQDAQTALGDEMGEAFDLDAGLEVGF